MNENTRCWMLIRSKKGLCFFSALSVQEISMSDFKFKLIIITSQMKASFELTPTRVSLNNLFLK